MNRFLYILLFCGQILIFNNSFAQSTETITGNVVCCGQTVYEYPFDPIPFFQATEVKVSSTIPGAAFTYQWQQSVVYNVWTNISGATQANYNPGTLYEDKAYRRIVKSSFGATSISNVFGISKTDAMTGNSICCSQVTGVFPFDPTPLGQTANTSVSSNVPGATYSYQWQHALDFTSFFDIPGATEATYNPPIVSSPAKYRRIVQGFKPNPYPYSFGAIFSNEISITKIEETITGNSICCSQVTSVFPFDPAPLGQSVNTQVRSTQPGATFTYQWQQFTNGDWVNVSGATQSSYDPTTIFFETKYRRVVQSSFGTINISDEVPIIKIEETLFGNAICCFQYSAVPFVPAPFTQAANTSVSSTLSAATFTYQWQHYINNAWANIPGATNVSYSPGLVSAEMTWYRRIVQSSFGLSGISNEVGTIMVYERILDNTICCSQITSLANYNAAPFKQTANTTVRSTVDDANPRLTYQWQQLTNSVWTNISGATQASYDYGIMPATSTEVKFRRIVKSPYGTVSTSNEVSVSKVAETILDNSICCSQITASFPFDPAPFNQTANTTVRSTASGATLTYQWQQSTTNSNVWTNIAAATGSTLDLPVIGKNMSYRRVVTSSYGTVSISNVVTVSLKSCSDRPTSFSQTICGDMAYYQLQHGDVINIGRILGSYDAPNIRRREFGFEYQVSYDEGKTWINAQPKELLSYDSDSPYNICRPGKHSAWDLIDPNMDDGAEACAITQGVLDYQLPAYTYDINKGTIQHIYIRRDYYEWYDPFDCSWMNAIPFSCGSSWFLKAQSNVVTITLTSGGVPKPIAPITSSRTNATCNLEDQTVTFTVPRLNNGEYYKWTIPSVWTANNNPLEGALLNQISVNTNSGDGNFAKGGQVCLEVTQGAQVNRQCMTIGGTTPLTVSLPSTIRGCEGETVVIKPVIQQAGNVMNPADYNFSWQANQSQNVICGNPALNNCKEMSITVSNVQQNPRQEISVTIRDNFGCKASAKTTLNAIPGWQMGVLNSNNDPVVKSNSTLALDQTNNYLYFVQNNGTIVRSYFNNALAKWQYVELRDKTSNTTIRSDGAVAFYKGATYKLFYVRNRNLYYCESTDNGQTWVNYSNYVIVANINSRIKVDGGNIYYITSDRLVYYKPIANTNAASVLVGNIGINYSPGIFTVEDGVLVYADQSYNMVAFNALTGSSYPINVPSGIKQANNNSTISIYSGNIYFSNGVGSLIILKKNGSTGSYDTYEEVKNLQLAGPLTINKQTGTVYAAARNVDGKQIYYLNGQWQVASIRSNGSSISVESGMVFGNGRAYYISSGFVLANAFYEAPCSPAVLRTTGDEYSQTGDVLNDPLSKALAEEHTMHIYPNPTNSQIKATFEISENSKVRVNIIPVTGGSSDVLSNTFMESGTQELTLDLSNYSSGVYLIQLYVNESLYSTSKVVKF